MEGGDLFVIEGCKSTGLLLECAVLWRDWNDLSKYLAKGLKDAKSGKFC